MTDRSPIPTRPRKLVELANTAETIMDGRVVIELINLPFLREGGSPAEYRAALDRAVAKGWLPKQPTFTNQSLWDIAARPP